MNRYVINCATWVASMHEDDKIFSESWNLAQAAKRRTDRDVSAVYALISFVHWMRGDR